MKTKISIKTLVFAAIVALLPFITNAQRQRKSPHDTVTAVISGANIKITYGSPAVNGRDVWGALVPYDKAWRGGADEATIFTTDKDLTIQGKKLPAGSYTVFVVPTKDQWTYIFNSQTGQWGIKRDGTANFDEAKNVITVTATPRPAEMSEHLKYILDSKGFALRWEKLEAPVAVK